MRLEPTIRHLALASVLSTGTPGVASAERAHFDPASGLRVTQPVVADSEYLEAFYYSGYADDRVTISNMTDMHAQFRSYRGFLARIVAYDSFQVPCSGNGIAGVVQIIAPDNRAVEINEQALCGDLIMIMPAGDPK